MLYSPCKIFISITFCRIYCLSFNAVYDSHELPPSWSLGDFNNDSDEKSRILTLVVGRICLLKSKECLVFQTTRRSSNFSLWYLLSPTESFTLKKRKSNRLFRHEQRCMSLGVIPISHTVKRIWRSHEVVQNISVSP